MLVITVASGVDAAAEILALKPGITNGKAQIVIAPTLGGIATCGT